MASQETTDARCTAGSMAAARVSHHDGVWHAGAMAQIGQVTRSAQARSA